MRFKSLVLFFVFLYSHLVLSCDIVNCTFSLNEKNQIILSQQNQIAHMHIYKHVTPFFINPQQIRISKQKHTINMESFSGKFLEIEFSSLFIQCLKCGADSFMNKISDGMVNNSSANNKIFSKNFIVMADSNRTKILTEVFYEYDLMQNSQFSDKNGDDLFRKCYDLGGVKANKFSNKVISSEEVGRLTGIDIIQDIFNNKLGFGDWLCLGQLTEFRISGRVINLWVLSNIKKTDFILLGSF